MFRIVHSLRSGKRGLDGRIRVSEQDLIKSVHLIRPFRGLRPAAQFAAEVAAPPYDVLTSAEARERASGKPWSFLHVSRPEIDLAPGIDPHCAAVYAKATENFRRMVIDGVLVRDETPCFYVYRMTMGNLTQIGVVVAAAVSAYDSNRIRKHELTRPDKEDDRVRHMDALNAQTGPVLLAYPPAPDVDAILARTAQRSPDCDVVADHGVKHSIWAVAEEETIALLSAQFDAMPALYIADGHHRSAAASRVAAARRREYSGDGNTASHEYFLAVAFPHHQMHILPYNRAVSDLNGMDRKRLLERIGERFWVEESIAPVAPSTPATFGLYIEGEWYRLSIRPELIPESDPLARLDVSLLAANLLGPVLDVGNPRTDRRIDFVGGIRGLAELENRVDSGRAACAFSLFATQMADLMRVADAGLVMPPKSTWFEPKLADGLVSHVLD